jgi:hypothetical protein
MELLAMEMKRMGLYVCRTLSYEGSSFTMHEERLTAEQRAVYDEAVAFMHRLQGDLQDASDIAAGSAALLARVATLADSKDKLLSSELSSAISDDDSESESDEESGMSGNAVWRYFWGQHQRFFMSLCAAMKVPAVVRAARAAVAAGKCVVIGIQSTGEYTRAVRSCHSSVPWYFVYVGNPEGMTARATAERIYCPRIGEASTKQALEKNKGGDDLDDFISAPAMILERLIEKTYRLPPKPRAMKRQEREERKRASMCAQSGRQGRNVAVASYMEPNEDGDKEEEADKDEDEADDGGSDSGDDFVNCDSKYPSLSERRAKSST